LLTSAPFALNKYNQEILATWIAMKLLTCEFSVPEDVVTPDIERSLLMGRRLPPEIMRIWIARYTGGAWDNVYLRHAATLGFAPRGTIPSTPPSGSFAKNAQSQTLLIGELFVQAITTTVRGLEFNQPTNMSAALKQIWPYRQNFLWPPGSAFSDAQASFIATLFDRLTSQLPHSPGSTAAHI
jgi:hypothetical protein